LVNLKACFSVLENEYRREDARCEGIINRSSMSLQFAGVLAGICVAQLIAETSKTNVSYLLVWLYCTSILISVASVVMLTMAMSIKNYLRFPDEEIDVVIVRKMSEIDYVLCLIDSIRVIIPHNRAQNDTRLNKLSIGIWLCAITVIIIFATLISSVLTRV